ncbi:MAG: PPK2 family polyphosphate kinase [Bacteroidia bacterium]
MTKLTDISTRAPKGLDKEKTKLKLPELNTRLSELQNVLYAQSKFKLLIIFQGMDASGKDGTVKSVFHGVNPLGCRVQAFKAPTEEERSHDFLWRIHKHVPENGMIQIFNRSHYEDILVPTVHQLFDRKTIEARYKHINNFEALLKDSNTIVLKFFLHISKEEQTERLNERKTNPTKFWKHSDRDSIEAKSWDKYMKVYNEIFKKCAEHAAWNIIPADQNWYRDYLVAKTIVKTLEELPLEFPKLQEEKSKKKNKAS